jgi:membrane-associated phospholipid phosphatase
VTAQAKDASRRDPPTGLFRGALLAIGLVAAAAFVADTALALTQAYLPFDAPLTRAIQAVGWGPLRAIFGLVDWLEGVRQVVAALGAIVVVGIFNRKALPLICAGAASGAGYSLTELVVHRPRPDAHLVHVIRHTNGFSYPSGHEVFFTWFCVLLIVCLRLYRSPALVAVLAWTLALLVLLVVAVGRVYDGEHWPSDVLGGLALGIAWTAIALALRPLSDPALKVQQRTLHLQHDDRHQDEDRADELQRAQTLAQK